MVKLPEWQNGASRRYVLSSEDIPELERESGVHEFVNRKPRGQAEEAAYSAYKRKHHLQAAAHHLGMMRASQASGGHSEAKKHKLVYDLHLQALGFDPKDHNVPDEIKGVMNEPNFQPAPKFTAHKADAFLLHKSEPLRAENPYEEWEKNYPELRLTQPMTKSERPVFKLIKASDAPLDVPFGTNKMRALRDFFDRQGISSINEKELDAAMRGQLKPVGRDYSGNYTRDAVQRYVDARPKFQYNWSTGLWEKAVGATQRHSSDLSNVLRLEATPEHIRRMKEAGVYDAFRTMGELGRESGHPINEGDPSTAGWVRWTGDPSGVMVDEVQTDYGRPWDAYLREMIGKEVRNQFPGESEDPRRYEELVGRYLPQWNQKLPEEKRKVIQKILFGNVHPAEVLQEGFDAWARGPGQLAGAPVHIWTPEGKAYLNSIDKDPRSWIDPKRDLPGHFHMTYRDIPTKRGYQPGGKYGELPTQKNPKLKRGPTQAEKKKGGKERKWQPTTETMTSEIRKKEIRDGLKKKLAELLKGKIEELQKANPGALTPGMSGGVAAPAGKIQAPTMPDTSKVKPMAPGALDAIQSQNAAQAGKLKTTNTSGMPKPAKLDIKMAELDYHSDNGCPLCGLQDDDCPECLAEGRLQPSNPDYPYSTRADLADPAHPVHKKKSRIPGKK